MPNDSVIDLYIAGMGDVAKNEAFKLANVLRSAGLKVEINHMGRGLKAEMKYANKIGAKFTLVLGDTELQERTISLKRMSDGEKFEANLDNIDTILNIIR